MTSYTTVGAVLGRPAYLAPEQLRGAPATSRTDQWQLARTITYLLSGNLPPLSNHAPRTEWARASTECSPEPCIPIPGADSPLAPTLAKPYSMLCQPAAGDRVRRRVRRGSGPHSRARHNAGASDRPR